MAFLETYLLSALYRFNCPDALETGEVQMGLITGERAAQIRRHLQACPHCRAEAQQLEDYLASLSGDLDVPFAQRFRTWVARLLPTDGFGPGLSPALSTRGSEVGQVIAYQAGDAQLSLIIQEDPAQPDLRAVLGLLIGAPPENVVVTLFQNNRPLKSAEVDPLGNFVFSAIKKGQYELLLRGETFEIAASPLVID